MRKILDKLLIMVMVLALFVPRSIAWGASTTENVTIESFIKELVVSMKLKISEEEKQPYIQAATQNGILEENEFKNYKVVLTREVSALIANRAEEKLNGEKYNNQKMYDRITDWKRISDLSSASKEYRESIVKVYQKGMMIGSSNGAYKHSRKFQPKLAVTKKEVKTIISRIKSLSKRRIMTPYGELTRTTKLPKNYKQYDYILESIPNRYYELSFFYKEITYSYKPKELEDYASPVKMKKMALYTEMEPEEYHDLIYMWSKKIETNLKTRLNVDYRTIDNSWINTLKTTYYTYLDYNTGKPSIEENKPLTDSMKAYIKKVKKNKTIIKASQVTVDPGSIYYDGLYKLRAYIRFQVVSGPIPPAVGKPNQEDLIFTERNGIYFPGLQKGKWYSGYVDITIGSRAMNGSIYNCAIVTDGLSFR